MNQRIFIILLLLTSHFSQAQSDSCGIRISLLTCTPGQELYSTFGHSALRVVDSAKGTDLVFNYGTFDFYDPDFYKKFVQGKLQYFVSIDELPAFMAEYEYYKRGVSEQVLNLNCNEKEKFVAALLENAKEENKYYKYDFNYDNCTTRLRDMFEKAIDGQLQSKIILPKPGTTFRHLIHTYLDKGKQPWSKLGIDILLGSPLDKKVTNREAMFLPDYMQYAFASATRNGQSVVTENLELNKFEAVKSKSGISPFAVFGILFFTITLLSFYKNKITKCILLIFDFLLFALLGILGILLLYMWFGTDHAMCKNNFNLLWALPIHLPLSFLIFTKKKWVRNYFRILFFYSIALLLFWLALPQQFNFALLPVIGIILIRSYFRSKE
jgi:hypothetical protein